LVISIPFCGVRADSTWYPRNLLAFDLNSAFSSFQSFNSFVERSRSITGWIEPKSCVSQSDTSPGDRLEATLEVLWNAIDSMESIDLWRSGREIGRRELTVVNLVWNPTGAEKRAVKSCETPGSIALSDSINDCDFNQLNAVVEDVIVLDWNIISWETTRAELAPKPHKSDTTSKSQYRMVSSMWWSWNTPNCGWPMWIPNDVPMWHILLSWTSFLHGNDLSHQSVIHNPPWTNPNRCYDFIDIVYNVSWHTWTSRRNGLDLPRLECLIWKSIQSLHAFWPEWTINSFRYQNV
jgi:hypothetical protein